MKKYIQILIIIALGFILYSNTFCVPMYLDDENIIESHLLKDVTNLRAIWKYRPFAFISYLTISFNRTYSGANVFSYHVVNLLIHLGAALGVFWLAGLLLKTPKAAAVISQHKYPEIFGYIPIFTALFFVCHPIQTQAVTYIIQRTTSLTAMFYLLSICLYLKARLIKEGRKHSVYYISSIVVCILAMFSKPIAFTLPLMILLIEFVFFDYSAGLFKKRLVYLLPFLLCLFIIPVTLFFTSSVSIQKIWDLARETTRISRKTYFLTQLNVILTYIRLFILPINQNLDYDYPLSETIFKLPVFFSFIFLVSLFLFALSIFRKNRLVSFGIFWFFLALTVESSIFPINDVIFEHRAYLPSVGFFLSMTTLILMYIPALKKNHLFYFLSILIFCYSVATYKRNMLWGNKIKFFKDVMKKSPDKSRPHNCLGDVYYKREIYDKAIHEFKKALEIDPNNIGAYYNIGNVYRITGKIKEAEVLYKKALELNPTIIEILSNLGGIYFEKGKYEEAETLYKKALEVNPDLVKVNFNLGVIYMNREDKKTAISYFLNVVEEDRLHREAYFNLGNLYFSTGQKKEAIRSYRAVIKIDPYYIAAYNNLGIAYRNIGMPEEAIEIYNKALKISNRNPQVYYNLGSIYKEIGETSKAIDLIKKAVEINPGYAKAYNKLAVIYYHKENYKQAIIYCDKARELEFINSNLTEKLKPYREMNKK